MTIRELCKHLVPEYNVRIVYIGYTHEKYHIEDRLAGDIVSDPAELYDIPAWNWTLYKEYFEIIY